MNKAKLAELLGNRIKSSESIENADLLKKDAPLPSTSSKSKAIISKRKRTKVPGKGKGKGKGKRSATKYNCKICDEEYVDGVDWIQCDDCNKWFHRMCGGDLSDDDRWVTIQDEEVPWSCTLCRQ